MTRREATKEVQGHGGGRDKALRERGKGCRRVDPPREEKESRKATSHSLLSIGLNRGRLPSPPAPPPIKGGGISQILTVRSSLQLAHIAPLALAGGCGFHATALTVVRSWPVRVWRRAPVSRW